MRLSAHEPHEAGRSAGSRAGLRGARIGRMQRENERWRGRAPPHGNTNLVTFGGRTKGQRGLYNTAPGRRRFHFTRRVGPPAPTSPPTRKEGAHGSSAGSSVARAARRRARGGGSNASKTGRGSRTYSVVVVFPTVHPSFRIVHVGQPPRRTSTLPGLEPQYI